MSVLIFSSYLKLVSLLPSSSNKEQLPHSASTWARDSSPTCVTHDQPINYPWDRMFNFSLRFQACSFFSFLNKPNPFSSPLSYRSPSPYNWSFIRIHLILMASTFPHLTLPSPPREIGVSCHCSILSKITTTYRASSMVFSGSFHYLTSPSV